MAAMYRSYGPVVLVALFVVAASFIARYSIPSSTVFISSEKEAVQENQMPPTVFGVVPPSAHPNMDIDVGSLERYNVQAQMWIAWLAALSCFITFVGVIFVWRAWVQSPKLLKEAVNTTRIASETLRHTKQASLVQLRPYILPKGIEVFENKVGGIETKMLWRNVGQTPTVRAKCNVFYALLPELPNDSFSYKTQDDRLLGQLEIGPGTMSKSIGPSISSVDMQEVRAKRMHLLLWSFIEYSDAMETKKRYRTEYCARIEYGERHGYQWSYIQHGPFNGWDNGCLYSPFTE